MNLLVRISFAAAVTMLAGSGGALATQPCLAYDRTERAKLSLAEVEVDGEVVEASEDYALDEAQYFIERTPHGVRLVKLVGDEHFERPFDDAEM